MPLVEQIEYRHHIQRGAVLVCRINIVIKRNKTYIVAREDIVNISADLDVISSETRKVFANNEVDLLLFCIVQKSLYTGTFKIRTRITVVNVDINEIPTLFLDVLRKYQLLIFYRKGLARPHILLREPHIYPCIVYGLLSHNSTPF